MRKYPEGAIKSLKELERFIGKEVYSLTMNKDVLKHKIRGVNHSQETLSHIVAPCERFPNGHAVDGEAAAAWKLNGESDAYKYDFMFANYWYAYAHHVRVLKSKG